jgi:hypothetical protein
MGDAPLVDSGDVLVGDIGFLIERVTARDGAVSTGIEW